jgi:hypothetical protein
MKMKNFVILLLILLGSFTVRAQEFDKQIDKARSAYKTGNYEESRFAVLNALHEIDIKIGQEVLALLPEKIGSLSFDKSADYITGTDQGYAGLYIGRTWKSSGTETLSLSVMGDSPLLTTVNTFLALPIIMAGADSNQKKIKVEGYRAMLERNVDEESGKTSGYSLMIPSGNSMLQLNYTGEINESDFLSMVNQVPVDKVIKKAQ